MKYQITLTKQTDSDLREIVAYILQKFQSEQIAAGQLERLQTGIRSLDSMPNRFRRYPKEPWHSRGLRMMPVDNYIIFYIPDTEHRRITVIRVMYCGRDIETQLNEHTIID